MTEPPIKILIVEDESIVAQDLQAILEDMGYYVPVFVDSGELAIAKTREIRPNLILMDIRLIGEMDGIQTTQKIQEQFDIPVIYLTAHGDEDTLSRAKITQPFGYIIKPFDEQQLRIIIEIALYKHQLDQKIKEHRQWLSTILNSIGDGVIVTDIEGHITFVNPSAEKITGWKLDEALNQPITSIFKIIEDNSENSLDDFLIKQIKSGESGKIPERTSLVTKSGSIVSISDSISPITKGKDLNSGNKSLKELKGTVLVFQDNTEKKLIQEKLRHQAFYDSLTNLPNRAWFRQRLNDALERHKQNNEYLFGILFLDLDRFKIINDSLGHEAGDELLIHVGAKLLNLVRPIDTVARLGGDEFAILIENTINMNQLCEIAERIQKDLSTSFKIKGNNVFTNASIGVVLSCGNFQTIDEVIQCADIAMYRAKEKGKRRYEIFDEAMRKQVVSFSTLENELRIALKQNELDVYYQPIISLATQKIMGFEALVVWHHPLRGLVSAGNFIDVAEETELILDIDNFVLKKACKQLKIWQQNHPDADNWTMSVNLSSRQFIKPNFHEEIMTILSEINLSPSCLKLEITEHIIIKNKEATNIIISRLKEFGITFSLDDFGTGYSSLSYLHRFPFSTLKIDRSFVNRINTDEDSLEIIQIIILLAKNLKLDVIAEGIESLEQMGMLQGLQCEYGQGYLFAKPLSASQFEEQNYKLNEIID